MLMGDYGWSPKRYEKWLARMILETVIRALLSGSEPSPTPPRPSLHTSSNTR